MNSKEQWENDWTLFVEVLDRKLREGSTNQELGKFFGGHRIHWSGTIEDFNFGEFAAVVDVALPERVVTLADGGTIRLDGITLAVEEKDRNKWLRLNVGDEVSFRATLSETKPPFYCCVELKSLKTGEGLIMIRLGNAVPTDQGSQ